MNSPAQNLLLFALLPALLVATVLHAQAQDNSPDGAAPNEADLRVRRVIAAGETFSDSRLALSFHVPETSVVRLQARGNFMAVEVEPVEAQSFFIYHTSYRIRRPESLLQMGSAFRACELPPIPADMRFEIETSCRGTIGWNEVQRTVRLIRRADVLHVFHLTHRTDTSDLGTKILASLSENREFRAPAN